MNKTAILELANRMERLPKSQFDMSTYASTRSLADNFTVTLQNHCHTTCCIAGEKVLLDGGMIRQDAGFQPEFVINGKAVDAYDYTVKKLGLSVNQALDLLFDLSLKTPKQAAQRLREMAE